MQYLLEKKTKSPPTSDDNDDCEGFTGRNARRGFRLAEFAFKASMTGINIADAVIDMKTSAPHHSSNEEAVQQPNTQQEEVIYKRTFITSNFSSIKCSTNIS